MPTQTIIIDEDILNREDYITNIITQIETAEEGTKTRIFLTSLGGDPFTGLLLVNTLNQDEYVNNIELIANNYICSTAFEVFYKFKGKRSIIIGTIGMYHHVALGGITAMGDFKNTYNTSYKAHMEKSKLLSEETIRFSSQFCNKKELKQIKDGRDCYFSYERMLQIFKGINVING